VPNDDQDGIGHSDERSLPAPPRGRAVEERVEVSTVGSAGGSSSFDQGFFKPRAPVCDAAGLPLARALVVPWTYTCPEGDVLVGGESGHVHPDLSNDSLDGSPFHPSYLLQGRK
jgi:hypothetical protein